MIHIRPVVRSDMSGILNIYGPIISNTHISFETRVPAEHEVWERVMSSSGNMPWLAGLIHEELVGYAYAGTIRGRKAYQWSVEASVYVSPEHHRKGIARVLYSGLFRLLKLQGYKNAFAGIALPNQASITFHKRMGFQPVGVFKNIGYKLGSWHSVSWWEKQIGTWDKPGEIIPVGEILNTPEGINALKPRSEKRGSGANPL